MTWQPATVPDVPYTLPAGNMALGVHMGAVTGAKARRYMQVAAAITSTCWQMYDRMPSGERLELRICLPAALACWTRRWSQPAT